MGELYNNDIQRPNILISTPSALRWGRIIIMETWKYVLESWYWYTRNNHEHDHLGDPIRRQKEMIVEEIVWRTEKIPNKHSHHCVKLSKPDLLPLPMENLLVMNEQIKMILISNK
jgi:hypothetical protein